MTENEKSKTEVVVQSAAKGGVSAVMPYVVIAGAGYLAVMALKNSNALGGIGNIGSGFASGVQEISDKIRDTITDASENIVNNIDNTKQNISNFIDKTKQDIDNAVETGKTAGTVYTESVIASGNAINPLATPKNELGKIGQKTATGGIISANSGNIGAGIGLSVGGALIDIFGVKTPSPESVKSSYEKKASSVTGFEVGSLSGLNFMPGIENKSSITSKTPSTPTITVNGSKYEVIATVPATNITQSGRTKQVTPSKTGTGDAKLKSSALSKYKSA